MVRKQNQLRQNRRQQKRFKKEKVASPVKPLKGQEIAYRRELNKLGRAMIKAVHEEVLSYLKANQESYVLDTITLDHIKQFKRLNDSLDHLKLYKHYILCDEYIEFRDDLLHKSRKRLTEDGIGDQLGVIFRRLNSTFSGAVSAGFAQNTSTQMVERVGTANKDRFDKTVHAATGVNLGEIVTAEGLDDFIELSVNKNVKLITSLPEEYLAQVEVIVNNGVASGARYQTIANEITSKVGSANSKLAGRIKTIAMNEVQTINSQITLRRSEALGITEGIFRTSDDEKVRPCHEELDDVRYELKQGAWSKTCQKYIQPGITDIN